VVLALVSASAFRMLFGLLPQAMRQERVPSGGQREHPVEALWVTL